MTESLIMFLHELETEDDEDVEALLHKLGLVLLLISFKVNLIVTEIHQNHI